MYERKINLKRKIINTENRVVGKKSKFLTDRCEG